jgi:hypothetical protein
MAKQGMKHISPKSEKTKDSKFSHHEAKEEEIIQSHHYSYTYSTNLLLALSCQRAKVLPKDAAK